MPYDETLANRVRETLGNLDSIDEKAMMGGLVFMCDDKMLVCVKNDELMVRLDPATAADAHEEHGVRPVSMGPKQMSGWVYVEAAVLRKDKELKSWIDRALAYNPRAASSKKKAKK